MKTTWVGPLLAVLLMSAGAAWKAGALPFVDAQLLAFKDQQKAAAKAKADKDKKPSPPLEFLASELVQLQSTTLPEQIVFAGPLVAPQTVVVRAKAAGTLVVLAVNEGDRIRAGQVLGRIELAELDTRVAERAAQLQSAQATLAQAQRTHAGNEQLAQQQFISGLALEGSRAALDTARANVQAAQASLDATRVGQREANLVAPIGGIVAKRHVLAQEKVSPEQSLVTIVDLARLELAGQVATHQVAKLAPGMVVQVQVEGGGETWPGRLLRIAPAADSGTRSIGVTVELANPQERLRAGSYASASVTLPSGAGVMTLPSAAIIQTQGQDQVWLIENGVLARRAVLLGRRDEARGRVEVLQGVLPTSQVLAARFDNLSEGAQAKVVAKTQAKADAALVAPAAAAVVKR
jgi:membrane fusion protein, multidrug efflux system